MFKSEFLGQIPFARALARQAQAFAHAKATGEGLILGFESEPVVTLGCRGAESDILVPDLSRRGFARVELDRGGQVTLHNPGQLVIFPVLPMRALGARAWICKLVETTKRMAALYGQALRWDARAPGLYAADGKVVAFGVRVRQGISTHGLAINVHNDLEPFTWIRACGHESSPVTRLSTDAPLNIIFDSWIEQLELEMRSETKACGGDGQAIGTSRANSTRLTL